MVLKIINKTEINNPIIRQKIKLIFLRANILSVKVIQNIQIGA